MNRFNKNYGYEIELFWTGLSGDNRKIGRFITNKSAYYKLINFLGRSVSIDLYDDKAEGEKITYKQLIEVIKNTNYGRLVNP
jgi:hypothetical protein